MNKLFFFMITAAVAAGCSNGSSSRGSAEPSSYEEQKLTLEQQEQQDPLRFLVTDGTYRQNMWGQFVLEGTISSSASVATYKDVTIEIRFYSQTETLLGTKEHTFYEYYKPGASSSFRIKVDGISGSSKIGWQIVRASTG